MVYVELVGVVGQQVGEFEGVEVVGVVQWCGIWCFVSVFGCVLGCGYFVLDGYGLGEGFVCGFVLQQLVRYEVEIFGVEGCFEGMKEFVVLVVGVWCVVLVDEVDVLFECGVGFVDEVVFVDVEELQCCVDGWEGVFVDVDDVDVG